MDHRMVNPWTWQDARMFVQGREVASGDMTFDVHFADEDKDFARLSAELRTVPTAV